MKIPVIFLFLLFLFPASSVALDDEGSVRDPVVGEESLEEHNESWSERDKNEVWRDNLRPNTSQDTTEDARGYLDKEGKDYLDEQIDERFPSQARPDLQHEAARGKSRPFSTDRQRLQPDGDSSYRQ